MLSVFLLGLASFAVGVSFETVLPHQLDSHFIVVFQDNSTEADMVDLKTTFRTNITSEFSVGSMKGFTVVASATSLEKLQNHGSVDFVEKDIPMRLKGAQGGSLKNTCDVQKNVPSWGISRVSNGKKLPIDNTYKYTDKVGSDVDVFMLDTGVRTTHVEFTGRASFGFNAAGGKVNTDKDGHGTHVAGTVAAQHYGICKACSIVSIKVFTDTGDCSAAILIKAFQWVLENAKKMLLTSPLGATQARRRRLWTAQ